VSAQEAKEMVGKVQEWSSPIFFRVRLNNQFFDWA